MKRIVLVLVASFSMLFCEAQVGTLSLRDKGKVLAPGSYETFYINGDTSTILVEQNASLLNARYELIRMDMNQNELARVRYKREKGRYYLDGFDNPSSIDLLVCEHDEDANTLKTFHERRDPKTLEATGSPRMLHSMSGSKKDKVGLVYRHSPDYNLQACVYVLKREDERAEAKVSLYSRQYEEYWSMTTRLHVLDFALVSDSGEVIIGGWGQKKDYSEAAFEVTVLDGEKDATYQFTCSEGRIMEVTFANYTEGRVQLFALVREDRNKDNGSQINRLLSLCYNTKTGKLTTHVHHLTAQEINCLYNEDYGTRAKSSVRFLQIDGISPAPDGHYDVLLSQSWTIYSQGGDRYARNGLLVATVDRDGQFTRIHTRHMESYVVRYRKPMNLPCLMRTEGGSLLFYTQHASSADRTLDRSVKEYMPGKDKGVLTTVFFPDDGQPEAQNIGISKYGVYGLPKRIDDKSFLFFFRDNGKAQIGMFKLQR